jgi:DNA-directed RNA polymerase alpha subunit
VDNNQLLAIPTSIFSIQNLTCGNQKWQEPPSSDVTIFLAGSKVNYKSDGIEYFNFTEQGSEKLIKDMVELGQLINTKMVQEKREMLQAHQNTTTALEEERKLKLKVEQEKGATEEKLRVSSEQLTLLEQKYQEFLGNRIDKCSKKQLKELLQQHEDSVAKTKGVLSKVLTEVYRFNSFR